MKNQPDRNTSLPSGVECIDGQWHINIDKFEPGMKPFTLEREDGIAYLSETGVRIETNAGDIYHHGRDGQTESFLRNIKGIAISETLQVSRSERIELAHGYVLNWYMAPSGSLHVTFDAVGNLDEVMACGLETQTSPNGVLTVARLPAPVAPFDPNV